MCVRDTMPWWSVHQVMMSPQVSCKSKGQHLFSLLLYAGCSSGSNNGMGWASSLVWCFSILSIEKSIHIWMLLKLNINQPFNRLIGIKLNMYTPRKKIKFERCF
jgi:hypothetical protein